MKILELENVCKKYPQAEALIDINLRAEENDIIGIIGPNGAGKTTLLRLIMGLIKPTSGSIELFGYKGMNAALLRKIGFAVDSDGMYRNLTGRQNLQFVAKAYSVDQYEKIIDKWADFLDISKALDQSMLGYSKGMTKKIAIIRAILHNPQLLVLDEPMIGLDIETQKKVMELLKYISKNTTILISSHILYQIEKMCNNVLILNGTVKYFGRIDDLKKNNVRKIKVTFQQTPETNIKLLFRNCKNGINARCNGKILELEYKGELDEGEIIKLIFNNSKVPIVAVEHIEPDMESLYYHKIGNGKEEK